MRNTSLRKKILLGYIVLTLLLGISISALVKTVIEHKLIAELQKRSLSIARDLAREVSSPILTEDAVALQSITGGHKKTEADVQYIFVMDTNGLLIANTFGESFPEELRHANICEHPCKYSMQRFITERGGVMDIAVPILNGEAGVLRIGFSEQPVKDAVNDIILMIIATVSAVVALGAWLSAAFSSAIIRPLFELSEAAEKIGTGDLNYRIAVKTGDETGRLAEVFNRMADGLKETMTSKDALQIYIDEIERFNRLAVDREIMMIELKKEINGLLRDAGKNEKYKIAACKEDIS
jgi:methyl-accepting chemotaxis protein